MTNQVTEPGVPAENITSPGGTGKQAKTRAPRSARQTASPAKDAPPSSGPADAQGAGEAPAAGSGQLPRLASGCQVDAIRSAQTGPGR